MRLGNQIKIAANKGLIVFLIAAMIEPTRANALSAGQLMTLPGFRNMVFAVANVNMAMRDAAQNPMDQWRRANVQRAMQAMPLALAGLAQEFKSGKLGDSALPQVQAMLGGYVDKGISNNFQSFLKNPDPKFIPTLGKDFPMPNGKAGAAAGAMLPAMGAGETQIPSISSPELANLNSATSVRGTSGKASDAGGLYFDENAKRSSGSEVSGAATTGSTEQILAGVDKIGGAVQLDANGNPMSDANFAQQAVRDLSSIESEAAVSAPTKVVVNKKGDRDESKDEFFNAPAKSKKEEAEDKAHSKKIGAKKRNAKDYSLKLKPEYWLVTPELIGVAQSLFSIDAHAEAQSPNVGQGQPGQNQPCATNPSGEGGGKGADFLFGVAAIMAAMAPMIIASTEANANKAIAKTNADAQIKMTQISASTSEKLANQQAQIASSNAQTSKDIAAEAQAQTTARLQVQVDQLNRASVAAQAQEDKRMAQEKEIADRRFALAEENLRITTETAEKQRLAALTANGLSQGFVSAAGSGSVAVTRTLGNPTATGTGGTIASGLGSQALGATGASGASATGLGFKANTATTSGTTSRALTSTASTGSSGSGLAVAMTKRGVASSKLLSNVSAANDESDLVIDVATGKKISKKILAATATKTASLGASISTAARVSDDVVGRALRGVMNLQPTVRGSNRTTRLVSATSTKKNSDLNRLLVTTTSEVGGFSNYLSRERGATAPAAKTTTTGAAHRAIQPYNAPEVTSGSSDTHSKKRGSVTYSGF